MLINELRKELKEILSNAALYLLASSSTYLWIIFRYFQKFNLIENGAIFRKHVLILSLPVLILATLSIIKNRRWYFFVLGAIAYGILIFFAPEIYKYMKLEHFPSYNQIIVYVIAAYIILLLFVRGLFSFFNFENYLE